MGRNAPRPPDATPHKGTAGGRLGRQVRGHERIEFLTPGRLLQKGGRRLALGENKDRFSVEDEEAFRAAKEAAEESR